ncbi:AraC family transcriptional regulator [Martelella sp. HB161492]|uniref:AraC family transcriptional regulator n=1 Tax=Martelella sp. HB161492 TaxID=2720726 RepID=UPI001590A048|nr:AraC family transcriptional regulator [Martelella sp. HB161492]
MTEHLGTDFGLRRETAPARAVLADAIARSLGDKNDLVTSIPGLILTRRFHVGPPESFLYEPSLSLVVQGEKRVMLGDTTYRYDETRFLLTALNLPTIAQVLKAKPEQPYLAILLKLDLGAAKQMIANIDVAEPRTHAADPGMATGPATEPLFAAVRRLVELLDAPEDIPVLADLIQREILYRLLTSPVGFRLRQIVRLGTHGNRVARAIGWLNENYASPLRVEQLAEISAMGVSTLYHHFRMMTAMSPLQFQKHLRLHEARRLMLSDELDAGSAAFRVGYESATQFNREYRRLFGAPPVRHVRALRFSSPPLADEPASTD